MRRMLGALFITWFLLVVLYNPILATQGPNDVVVGAILSVTASPNPITIKPDEYGWVTYTFENSGGCTAHIFWRSGEFLAPDGTVLRETWYYEGPYIDVPAGGSVTWDDYTYMPPDVAEKAQQLGLNEVILHECFGGEDDCWGNTLEVCTDVRIIFNTGTSGGKPTGSLTILSVDPPEGSTLYKSESVRGAGEYWHFRIEVEYQLEGADEGYLRVSLYPSGMGSYCSGDCGPGYEVYGSSGRKTIEGDFGCYLNDEHIGETFVLEIQLVAKGAGMDYVVAKKSFTYTTTDSPSPPLPSHTYGPVEGWYLVSVPAWGAKASNFGTTLWFWNGVTYESVSGQETLDPKKGYWAYLLANTTVVVPDTVPETDVVIDLGIAGWHMISAPWPYRKTDILVIKGREAKSWAEAVATGWVHDNIYTYKASDGQYTTPETLDPWYGYWVRTYVDGILLKLDVSKRLGTSCACVRPTPKITEQGEKVFPPPLTVIVPLKFDVVNEPNPITDVHTTTFKVLGPMASQVEEMRVRIFDLAGRLVWEGEAYGPELVWHTEDLAGRYLANGVYLYQVQVKVGGTWITTSLKKLAIYR